MFYHPRIVGGHLRRLDPAGRGYTTLTAETPTFGHNGDLANLGRSSN
jgi:hypothetical protein